MRLLDGPSSSPRELTTAPTSLCRPRTRPKAPSPEGRCPLSLFATHAEQRLDPHGAESVAGMLGLYDEALASRPRCPWIRPGPRPCCACVSQEADVAAALSAGTAGHRRYRQAGAGQQGGPWTDDVLPDVTLVRLQPSVRGWSVTTPSDPPMAALHY